MDLTIDRNIWLRGTEDDSFLLAPETHESHPGKMCCVGIYLNACGVSKEMLVRKMTAHDGVPLVKSLPKNTKWLIKPDTFTVAHDNPLYIASSTANLLYGANDEIYEADNYDSDGEPIDNGTPEEFEAGREARIAELFAKHDVNVTFVG